MNFDTELALNESFESEKFSKEVTNHILEVSLDLLNICILHRQSVDKFEIQLESAGWQRPLLTGTATEATAIFDDNELFLKARDWFFSEEWKKNSSTVAIQIALITAERIYREILEHEQLIIVEDIPDILCMDRLVMSLKTIALIQINSDEYVNKIIHNKKRGNSVKISKRRDLQQVDDYILRCVRQIIIESPPHIEKLEQLASEIEYRMKNELHYNDERRRGKQTIRNRLKEILNLNTTNFSQKYPNNLFHQTL